MPIDTSMYNRPMADPNAQLNGTIGVANALTQNQILNTQNNMLQQGYAADQAVGQAAAGAIDPQTGAYSPNAFSRAVAANPAAAYHAPAALQANATLKGSNLTNQGAATGQAQSRMTDYYGSLGPILANKNAPTRADVMGLATDMLHQGRLLPQDLLAINDEVPLNPKQITSYAQNKFASALSPAQQANPTTTGVDPTTGQPVQGTAVQALKKATDPQSQGYTTTLPVGVPEQIKTNNDAYMADQATGAATMANVRNLQKALPLIEQLGQSSFGPGSQKLATAKAALTTLGVIPPGTSDVDVRQELYKYMSKFSGGAGQAGRSDAGLYQAIHSNPNLDLTQTANLALVKNQIAMDRMDSASTAAFDAAHPNAPNKLGYLAFKSQYNQSNDPRAFGLDNMAPSEKADLAKGLGPRTFDAKGKPTNAKYERFNQSVLNAEKAGMYGAPGGQ